MWELLFKLAIWHGLAKLHQHTKTTVCNLENSTTQLGDLLCTFQNNICSKYQTFDLPSEEAARARRKAAAAKKAGQMITKPVTDKGKGTSSGSQKSWKFNLDTYKTHSLGGYTKAIRLFGSPDNYNSQTVSDRSCLLWKSHTYRANLSIGKGNTFSNVCAKENMSLVLVYKFSMSA